jgi:hypothetical protein
VDYFEFKRKFDAEHDAFVLPADCKELGDPLFLAVTQYSWQFKWYLQFSADKFIRIWEHHKRMAGLQDSRRLTFAYHYGDITALGKDGLPTHGSDKPVDFRIDNSLQRVHLHLGSPAHIYQENVQNLDLNSVGMFDFLRGVFKHRSSGKDFARVFGFKIV